jgi:hypothetical protein
MEGTAAGPPGLAEPLTGCGLAVRRLLATGKFDQRIATTWWHPARPKST